MRSWCLCLAMLAIPGAAAADEVFLKGGGRLVGLVVERSEASVTLDTAPGRVSIPMSRVERIVEGGAALITYQSRAARLAPNDVQGWLDLGLWAREANLSTQARQAFERVVSIDPSNAVAQQALGNAQLDGRWVAQEEYYRARGYIQFDGRWVTPEERDHILAQRAADARGEQLLREAEARAREAEARARQAEAEAQRAEVEKDAAASPTPGPLVPWWLLGGSGGHGGCHEGQHEGCRDRETPPATPTPRPCPQGGSWSGQVGCGDVRPWSEGAGSQQGGTATTPAPRKSKTPKGDPPGSRRSPTPQ
jgi:hypothetical protein